MPRPGRPCWSPACSARCSPPCSASCRCCGTAATARWPAGGRPSRRPGSSSTSWATPSPRPIPLALGVRADGGLDSLGGWTTLGAVLAVLVLVNKSLNDAVHIARSASGLPRLEDRAEEAAPRVSSVAPAAVAGQVRAVPPGLPLGRADPAGPGGRRRRRGVRRAGRDPGAGGGAGAGRGRHRGRSPGGDPHARAGCGEPPDRRGRGAQHGQPAGRASRARSSRCSPSRASSWTSWWSATAGSRWACRRGCAPCTCRRTSASRRAATSGPPTSRGDVLFFYDDDAYLPTDGRGGAAGRRAGPRTRGWAAVQPRPVDPTGKPSPKRWVPRPGGPRPAAAGRGGLGLGGHLRHPAGTCSSRPAAGRGTSSTATRASSSSWRVWDAGRHDLVRPRRRDEPPGHLADPARHLLPAERAQPGLGRAAEPSVAAGRRLPAVWTVLTVVRFRSPRLLRVWFAGFREGLGPGCRGTAADALADRVAADACRSTAGRLTYRFRTGGGP